MLPFILMLAMLNGLASPLTPLLFHIAPAWLPGALPEDPRTLLYLSQIACATLTLLLAGIPAAVFERNTGRTESDDLSVLIWLGATAFLTLPALPGLLSLFASR